MADGFFSAGIDIGTTTTQLVISRLTVRNTGGFGDVPRVEIVGKEIVYQSAIHLTPLVSEDEMDAVGIEKIIRAEIENAGLTAAEIETGAVIITGESARKHNAEAVVERISEISGRFVSTVAGPDLEGILAGRGAGAAALSEQTGMLVANLDIGGGTTNICLFEDGHVVDTACLDIGGRLIRVNNGYITYIAPKVVTLAQMAGIHLTVGMPVSLDQPESLKPLQAVASLMVQLLELALFSPMTANTTDAILLEHIKTNKLLQCGRVPDYVTLSGGVADCVSSRFLDKLAYGDIGIFLGEAIAESSQLRERMQYAARETLRATVIGAGIHTIEVSGSTIFYRNVRFPLRNRLVSTFLTKPDSPYINSNSLQNVIDRSISESVQNYCSNQAQLESNCSLALATAGIRCPSYLQIEEMALQLEIATKKLVENGETILLVIEQDMAKALGQALQRRLPQHASLLCIDGIHCREGDFLDIGHPLGNGAAVPVVVKTLVFG